MAKRQREAALKRYYENPNVCKQCGKIIEVVGKVREARVKKFCNKSCAAKYNNKFSSLKPHKRYGKCEKCNCEIIFKKRKNGGYYKRKFCIECRLSNGIHNKTIDELFSSRKHYQSARSNIRRHAYYTYKNNGKEFKCSVCGYDLHVEICHIRPVSDFPKNIKIKVVNYINNLVALCPNHHWELDNGHLNLRMGEVKVKF